jgi:hypothetical protein
VISDNRFFRATGKVIDATQRRICTTTEYFGVAADSCVNWEQGWTAASSFPGGRDLVADISGPTETGPARRELLPRIRSQAQRSSRRCRPKRIHQPMLVSRFWRVSCSNLHVIRRSLRPTRISQLARVLVVGRASNVSQHRARPHPAGIGGSQGTNRGLDGAAARMGLKRTTL